MCAIQSYYSNMAKFFFLWNFLSNVVHQTPTYLICRKTIEIFQTFLLHFRYQGFSEAIFTYKYHCLQVYNFKAIKLVSEKKFIFGKLLIKLCFLKPEVR